MRYMSVARESGGMLLTAAVMKEFLLKTASAVPRLFIREAPIPGPYADP
jgi:hypothetical protein